MMFGRSAVPMGMMLLSLVAAVPAAAQIEVVRLEKASSGYNSRWVRSASNGDASFYTTSSGTGTTAAGTLMNFVLADPDHGFTMAAVLNLSASTQDSPAVLDGGIFTQAVTTGSFVVQAATPTPYRWGLSWITPGMTLLQGDFAEAVLSGTAGATSGQLEASPFTLSLVNLSSPLFTLAQDSQVTLAFNLTSMSLGLARQSESTTLNSFRANLSGTIESDIAPLSNYSVPEPQTWAMMLIGFGLVGAMARRARPVARA